MALVAVVAVWMRCDLVRLPMVPTVGMPVGSLVPNPLRNLVLSRMSRASASSFPSSAGSDPRAAAAQREGAGAGLEKVSGAVEDLGRYRSLRCDHPSG